MRSNLLQTAIVWSRCGTLCRWPLVRIFTPNLNANSYKTFNAVSNEVFTTMRLENDASQTQTDIHISTARSIPIVHPVFLVCQVYHQNLPLWTCVRHNWSDSLECTEQRPAWSRTQHCQLQSPIKDPLVSAVFGALSALEALCDNVLYKLTLTSTMTHFSSLSASCLELTS